MNTLQARRPSAPATVPRPLSPPAGPALLDRLAMRVGLWLLLWGRHRAQHRAQLRFVGRVPAAYRDPALAEQVRREYDRVVLSASSTPPVR